MSTLTIRFGLDAEHRRRKQRARAVFPPVALAVPGRCRTAQHANALVEPLSAGLQALLGPGPHDMAAFSFGSLVAVLLAAERPELVRWLGLGGAPAVAHALGRGMPLKP